MNVIKRSGEKVVFNPEKIKNAIQRANVDNIPKKKQLTNEQIDKCVENIVNECQSKKHIVSVEEIQDMVEKELINGGFAEVAIGYIKFRYDHEKIRNSKSEIMAVVAEKLKATNVQNQNANLDERSFSGRMNEANSVVMKEYALNNCMSKMARENHENNLIYIHDLDSYAVGMHNCLSIPFDKILANGFKTRQTDVRSPRSINTAMQLVAVVMQLQSLQQYGGVSATHIDWTMVPYVRFSFYKHYKDGLKYIKNIEIMPFSKEESQHISINSNVYKEYPEVYRYAYDMTVKETHQAVEAMYHNLNTLQSRSGQQLPFSSINYGTCTLEEGRMVIKELLNVSIEGLGELGKTPIFPCGIFQCMKGVNRKEGEPNYDLFKLALESTSKRLYPNYVNVDWSNNAGYDPKDPKTYMSTMGKRNLAHLKSFEPRPRVWS